MQYTIGLENEHWEEILFTKELSKFPSMLLPLAEYCVSIPENMVEPQEEEEEEDDESESEFQDDFDQNSIM